MAPALSWLDDPGQVISPLWVLNEEFSVPIL